ncbi:MAG: serine hydroxymethyltransferase, partial [Candidatus Methanomethylicia archaeon]
IRLGTAEVTRLGMKESDMEAIADFITDVLIKNKPSIEVSKSVAEFRRNFNKCHYCFDSVREAYEYIKLR